jgi:hypothetical protein
MIDYGLNFQSLNLAPRRWQEWHVSPQARRDNNKVRRENARQKIIISNIELINVFENNT